MTTTAIGPAARRDVCGLALALSTGCSLIGVRVPHRPPAPTRCPSIAIAADGVGATLSILAVAALTSDRGSAPVGLYLLPPYAALGVTYIASTIYGLRARGRCDRIRRDGRRAWAAEQAALENGPVRAAVIAERPLQCALTAEGNGACFLDVAACAAAVTPGGLACEPRTHGWCLDTTSIAGGDTLLTCAVTREACETDRAALRTDRSLTVSTCGSYTVRATPTEVAP